MAAFISRVMFQHLIYLDNSVTPLRNRIVSRLYVLTLRGSFSFVVMLKDDSELEYPQCEIRARQHWYPIPNYF